MAKYVEVFEHTENIFLDKIAAADLERVIHVKILANNKQKELGKVVKANDLLRHMTNEDVIIVINETIFNGLEIAQQEMAAEELVTYISYNYETDKLSIAQPDIKTFSLVLRKFGFEAYERLHESIKALYDQKANKEEGTEAEDEE